MSIEAAERLATPKRSRRVVELLESTCREVNRFGLAMALVGLSMTLLAGFTLVGVADIIWVLPRWIRAMALLGLIATAAISLSRFLRSRRQVFGPIEMATRIEAAYPQLGQRVRTTLEYLEPTSATMPASGSLVDALVADTDRRTRPLAFALVVPWSRLNARLIGLVTSIAAVIAGVLLDSNLSIATRRVLLLPAHYTTLEVEPGNQTLKAGSEFTLRATFSGRPVRSARLLRRLEDSKKTWDSSSLGDTTRPMIGTVELIAKDIRADFEYKVVAGELESDVYRVRVTHPLVLKSIEAVIEPPAYTKLRPTVARNGDFSVPEGSRIRFSITLDRAPTSARIEWTSAVSATIQAIPLAMVGNQLTGELPPLDKDASYHVIASAADGMALEPVSYKIKVTPDRKPTLRFLKPAENYSATATTEVPIKLHADDDYGLSKVGILYRIGDGPEQTLYVDEPGKQPVSTDALTTLFLEKHKLTITDSLSYQAFVEDNKHPVHQRVTSELRFIDIAPYRQDFQMSDGGGAPSDGTSVTLEEVILRQRLTLNRTLSHLEDRPVSEKVAERLSKDEADLTFTTEEFATKLASQFGPINPLADAVQAMQAATASLASRDFVASMPLERSALASLVKARKNLRILMSSPTTAPQLRKIDRQQSNQKFRTPPAEKSTEAELARLEADVRKLAEAEKKYAEDIAPKPGEDSQVDQDAPAPDSKPSASLAQRQQEATAEAERLSSLAGLDKSFTQLARTRIDEAARTIKKSESALKSDDLRESARNAREAADQLERLAGQIAALKAEDIAARIARARDLALAMARAERELTTKRTTADPASLAREQSRLAEDAKTLADLMRQLSSDATEQDRTLATALERSNESHSVAEIERTMRQATAEIEANQSEKSARSMELAEKELSELARAIDTARRDFMQPKLQQLLKAEKLAAQARKALESVFNQSQKAEAEKAMADLSRSLEALKTDSGSLREASESLEQATLPGASSTWNPPPNSGAVPKLYRPPTSYSNAVGQVAKALQTKIQELILSDGLVDRDGPVPPGYKEKVENYFRVLSEDLR